MKQKKDWNVFSHIDVKGYKKILKLYYTFDVSESFLECMKTQLTNWYLKFMSLTSNQNDWLNFESNKQLGYEKARISKISAQLFVENHPFDIQIAWHSISEKIYEPHEEIIDCNDIIFEIKGLDLTLCKYYKFPDKSLFFPIYTYIDLFKKIYNLNISEQFMKCANKQLTADFIRQTGIGTEAFRNIFIAPVDADCRDFYKITPIDLYKKGYISKISLYPSVGVDLVHQLCYMCWQSKSSKIYEVSDINIDENDIKFWFENLQPDYYQQLLYAKNQLPFKLNNLTFELVIVRFNIDTIIKMTFRDTIIKEIDSLLEEIDNYILKFINNSIKIGKEEVGVIHNFKRKFLLNNQWEYEIDTGSAGILLYKKLLPFLSKLNCLLKVEIS